jgi:sulfur-oxidizing protein SoxY
MFVFGRAIAGRVKRRAGPDQKCQIIYKHALACPETPDPKQKETPMSATHSRREVLTAGAIAAFAAVLAPRMSFATPKEVETAINALYKGKAMKTGKITLELPQIAENGLVVPVNVSVESKMTDSDYVKAVHVFADGNPLPGVVSYKFTPASGQASANIRMRLAKTQNVICVAEMSDGTLYTAKSEVKVTIGGCGG